MLLFLAGLVGGGEGWAAVRLPKLVGDRMVLQRETELKIWGWADPGEKVTVRFRDTPYYTEADGTGKWHVMLPPQQPGGPFLMEVNEKVIRDVLVGDVYLCGGQSNQETPIERLVEKFPEIPVSNNHMIRHYKVPSQDVTDGVREEIAGDAVWHSATASEVMNWTSLAYFFATEVWNRYHVPVGMLVASKGGTDIESWISQERLKDFPRLLVDEEAVRKVKNPVRIKVPADGIKKISMIRIGLRRKCRVRGMSAVSGRKVPYGTARLSICLLPWWGGTRGFIWDVWPTVILCS